jgi:hypothetical protein
VRGIKRQESQLGSVPGSAHLFLSKSSIPISSSTREEINPVLVNGLAISITFMRAGIDLYAVGIPFYIILNHAETYLGLFEHFSKLVGGKTAN